jgi:hypothetical protein
LLRRQDLLRHCPPPWIKTPAQRRVVVVFDGPIPKAFAKSAIFKEIVANGRHKDITIVCTAQYLKDLPPEVRVHMDYWFFGGQPPLSEKQSLKTNFFEGQFGNCLAQFAAAMDHCTQNHGWLVKDCSCTGAKAATWYQVSNLQAVRTTMFGVDSMWRVAHAHQIGLSCASSGQQRVFDWDKAKNETIHCLAPPAPLSK